MDFWNSFIENLVEMSIGISFFFVLTFLGILIAFELSMKTFRHQKQFRTKLQPIILTVIALFLAQDFAQATGLGCRNATSLVETSSQTSLDVILSFPERFNRVDYLKALAHELQIAEAVKRGEIPSLLRGQQKKLWVPAGDIWEQVVSHPQGAIPAINNLQRVLSRYPESFLNLLVDPGLITHSEAFLTFLENCKDCSQQNPWMVREAFSRSLGSVRRYRAVAVNANVLAQMRSKGVIARGLDTRSAADAKQLVTSDVGFNAQFAKHIDAGTLNSQFISVTTHPDVAIDIAKKFLSSRSVEDKWNWKSNREQGNELYLIEIIIPVIDLVFNTPTGFNSMLSSSPMAGSYLINSNGSNRLYPINENLESLLIYRINPSEIQSITKINKEP